jgi:hypothetical protein
MSVTGEFSSQRLALHKRNPAESVPACPSLILRDLHSNAMLWKSLCHHGVTALLDLMPQPQLSAIKE